MLLSPASAQAVLEEVLVDVARGLHAETGLADLCLGGSVALNGCANARLLAESGFERLFVPPAPGDAGCALGAALYADRIHFGQPDREIPDHPFWGPLADASELARIAAEDGLPLSTLPSDAALCEEIAAALAAGEVVGWMEGAAELGPRALGHRSILAAPHDARTRDRLNLRIKRREEFRPYAPAVPVELAERYFELPSGGARVGRFMSGVFPVRPEWRARLGASHPRRRDRARADRGRDDGPPVSRAAARVWGRSGIPILLNTSFNLAGEPIVNRAVEGYTTFRRSDLDLLVVGCAMVTRARAPPLPNPGGGRVIKRRGRAPARTSAAGHGPDRRWALARGDSGGGGQRWMLPLAVFLCATGLILLFAFSVEAVAPFIYAIF